jgi:hypothetical protein
MNSDLTQRLACKRNLQCYLSQLCHLANRNVTADDLLPLEVTHAIREQSTRLLDKTSFRKFKIKFSEKLDTRFAMFVKNLYALNPSPVYIWVEHTNTCGLFEISSIMEFNAKFEYSVITEGIISLLTKDMIDNMVLDFYEDSSGEKFIEIELYGSSWVTCVY